MFHGHYSSLHQHATCNMPTLWYTAQQMDQHCAGTMQADGGVTETSQLHNCMQDVQSHMDEMYSRGIDPNMADPTKCHSHPDVPPQWPAQPQVKAYVQKVCLHHCCNRRVLLWTCMNL